MTEARAPRAEREDARGDGPGGGHPRRRRSAGCSPSPRRTRSCRRTRTSSQLQTELAETENRVAVSRQVYNDTVLTFNNTVQTFPGARRRGPVRLHHPRVLRGRGRGTTRGAGRRLLSAQDRNCADFRSRNPRRRDRVRSRTFRSREDRWGRPLRGRGRIGSSSAASSRVGSALALPGVARADSFSLLAGRRRRRRRRRDGSLGVSERIEVAFSGDFHYGYRDIPLREGRDARRFRRSPSAAVAFRAGNADELEPGRRGTFGVERRGDTRAHRLVLRRARPDACVHDLVHASRRRGRVRRRRRRQPEGLGRSSGTEPLVASRRRSRRRRGRSCAPGASPSGCAATSSSSGARATLRAVDVPAHQFVELRTAHPALRRSPRRSGMRVERGHGFDRDRRGGARRRRARTSATAIASTTLKEHPLRTGLVAPRARDDSRRLLVIAARLLVPGPRASHRVRPRVRAGASDRHGAGARPDAPAPGWRGRLVRVHGDAVRPHPTRRLQGRARRRPSGPIWGGLRTRDDLRPRALGRRGRRASRLGERRRRRRRRRARRRRPSGCRASASGSRTSASRCTRFTVVQGRA